MPASQQAKINRGKPLLLATASIAAAPTDGTTQPHLKMSPKSPTGLSTTGFFLGLKAPGSGAATAIAAGFSLVVWVVNPVGLRWFSTSTTVISYNQAFVTFDFNPSGLYFQITAASVAGAGNVYVHTWEQ